MTSEPLKVEYKQLGKSGLRVSVPILGASWQSWVIDEQEALPRVKAAYERDLNTWDTANVYSNVFSEEVMAKLSRIREGNSPAVMPLQDIDKTVDYVNQRGLSRRGMFAAVNESLKRLETDLIDVLQIHRFDKTAPVEETMKALHDLVESGKFVAEKHDWTTFVSMQNFYNLLYGEEEREMNKFCMETGVEFIPWGPLLQGQLARPHHVMGSTPRSSGKASLPEADVSIISRVEEVAKKKGWKRSHVAIAWLMYKGISSPIIGFSTVERIDEALEGNRKTLTDEEVKYLEESYVPKNIMGHS